MDTSEVPGALNMRLDDLKSVQKYLLRSMDEKIDSRLSSELVDSRSKQEITEILHDLIYDTMEIAQHAIELVDVLPNNRSKYSLQELITNKQLLNQKIEPFDYALNEKVRQLYTEVEEQSTKVNDLRRSTPSEVLHTRELNAKRLTEDIDSLIKEARTIKKRKTKERDASEQEKSNDDDDPEDNGGDPDSDNDEENVIDSAVQADILGRCKVMREDYEQVLEDIYDIKTRFPSLNKVLNTLDVVDKYFPEETQLPRPIDE